MASVKKPYYVNFTADKVPSSVDHSQSNPGPTSGNVRAGYTSMVVKPKLSIVWADPPKKGAATMDFYAESINIFFFLKDIKVAISKDYAKKSCPYKVTLEHEMKEHVQPSIKMFYAYRDKFVEKVNKIAVPSKSAPKQMKPADAVKQQQKIEKALVETIGKAKAELTKKLKDHQRSVDTPAKYRAIYAKCPPADW